MVTCYIGPLKKLRLLPQLLTPTCYNTKLVISVHQLNVVAIKA